jgi:long-subunit fatty acid transport protein
VRRAAATAAAALGLGLAAPARANPADMFGFGARGAAMGNAQVAAANDGTAAYYNPALLARLDDIGIDVGYQAALPTLRVDGGDTHTDPSRGFDIDLVVPGRIGGARLAIGACLFLPDQQITRLRSSSAEQPRFILYDNLPQRLVLAAVAAVSLGDRLQVGGGISYMSSTKGTVQLSGLLGFPRPEDSNLALAIDVDLLTIRYPVAGVSYRALPWLDLGFSYRGGFYLTVDLAFSVHGDVGEPGMPPVVTNGHLDLEAVTQDLFQPAQYTAGFDARLTPRLQLAFDLTYKRWSAFQNPSAHITFDLDVGQFNDLVDIPPFPPLPEPNFHDIAVPRVGVEWLAADSPQRRWFGRAGYVYEPSPAPEQVGESNFIDNDKHTVSIGAGLELSRGLRPFIPRPVSFDAFLSLTELVPRDHRKISPIDPAGDYRSSGHVLAMGLLSRWRF